MKIIDLRSDTVTKPTEEMRRAMAEAEVGDDVYGEDPTVNELENLGASLMGKEAALYLPSGTMGNLVAVLTHTHPGDEILVEAQAHIYYYEVGGISAVGGVIPRTIATPRGVLSPRAVREAWRGKDLHLPTTTLLCLENTHNRAGGTVTTVEETRVLAGSAHEMGLKVHLDGARIFNAATCLGVEVKELAAHVDSVQFCLSKGLSAPVGSLLAGKADFIEKARKKRKMLGGGMRQAGVLAAAGLVALKTMVQRLAEDHANAKALAEGLAAIPGVEINPNEVMTNILVVDVAGTGLTPAEASFKLKERGILANPFGPTTLRFVTHKDVSREDITTTIQAAAEAWQR